MRNRTKDNLPYNTTIKYFDHNYMSGTTTVSDYGVTLVGTGTKQLMTDVSTPGFKGKSSSGRIINNDMSTERFDLDCPGAQYAVRNKLYNGSGQLVSDYGASVSQVVSGYEHAVPHLFVQKNTSERDALLASIPAPSVASADQVLVDAIAKANSSDVMALVSMAEAKKTLNSIAHASKVYTRIWDYCRRLRPRDFTPSGALRQVGNGLKVWLEVRYGLLPTYYDILGYADYVKKIGTKHRARFTSMARASGSPYTTLDQKTVYDFYEEVKTVARYRTREVSAGCLVEPIAEGLDALYTLGIDRIQSTAWELVPFSFICDWFFNTSKLIAAHEGRFNQRTLATWSKTKDSVLTTFALRSSGTTRVINGETYVGSYKRTWNVTELYSKTVRKADPKVPLFPSIQVRLDWKKALDLAAISGVVGNLSQRMRRK